MTGWRGRCGGCIVFLNASPLGLPPVIAVAAADVRKGLAPALAMLPLHAYLLRH